MVLIRPPYSQKVRQLMEGGRPKHPHTALPQGYRYELWCLARAAGVKYCMVHVDTPVEQCSQWNVGRAGTEDTYPASMYVGPHTSSLNRPGITGTPKHVLMISHEGS
jgi:hypothetical protein